MNLQNLGMIKIGEGLYAKVVKKGSCTRQFNEIRKEIGGDFRYVPISMDDPEKLNGYDEAVKQIEVDWETENLIIVKV